MHIRFAVSVTLRATTAAVLLATGIASTGSLAAAEAVTTPPTVLLPPLQARQMSPPSTGDGFGCAIAVSGTELLVGSAGAYHETTSQFGPAVFWVYPDLGAGAPAELTSPHPLPDPGAVSISGSTALVAQFNGSAYVFQDGPRGWRHTATLVPEPEAGLYSPSYVSVAISGDTAILGEPNWSVPGGNNAGEAFIFQKDAGAWHQVAYLGGSIGETVHFLDGLGEGSEFGKYVAASEHTLAIAGPGYGADAYVYRDTASGWRLGAVLSVPQSDPGYQGAPSGLAVSNSMVSVH